MKLLASAYGFGLLVLAASLANGRAANKPLTFDAASVKVADKALIPFVSHRMKGGPGTSDPGRIAYTQITLIQLLMRAWDVEYYRIDGPAWLKGTLHETEQYTIIATMPPKTTKPQFRVMLQNLLVERFQIQLHHETRNFPGYELVVAPGGPKLREPANPDAPEPDHGPTGEHGDDGFLVLPTGHGAGVRMPPTGGVYAKFQNCTIAELIDPYLRSFIQLSTGAQTNHIVDKTGLAGKYDYSLKFDTHGLDIAVVVSPGIRAASSGSSASDPGLASDPSGLPNLFSAMEKQLGLKLVKSKGFPLDTIVIDHIEKTPTEN
jgi:uncharacterized protein (TIGR03435 family)